MAKMFNYKLKVVSGYKGTNDVHGAVDRKEVHGLVQPYTNWEKSHLHKNGTVGYLVQFGYSRLPNLADVPTMVELARNDEERKILRLVSSPSVTGRNFALPPNTPNERVTTLRKAFDEVVKDKEFVAAMVKANLEVEPMNGDQLEKLIAEVMATPKPLIDRTRQYLGL
jgi:tripartite-type tricarboxylate transporter receptor subunit TctC